MARVTLSLPKVLKASLGTTTLELSNATLAGALEDACVQLPALRIHLFESKNRLRTHVLCFHNDENIGQRITALPLQDGDKIVIFQAVSGG
jgi:molybdopterin converting factor small subunit